MRFFAHLYRDQHHDFSMFPWSLLLQNKWYKCDEKWQGPSAFMWERQKGEVGTEVGGDHRHCVSGQLLFSLRWRHQSGMVAYFRFFRRGWKLSFLSEAAHLHMLAIQVDFVSKCTHLQKPPSCAVGWNKRKTALPDVLYHRKEIWNIYFKTRSIYLVFYLYLKDPVVEPNLSSKAVYVQEEHLCISVIFLK